MESVPAQNGCVTPTVDVAMLGARLHYAVPKLLYRERMLGRFFTDTFLPPSSLLHQALAAADRIVRSDFLHRWLQRTDSELNGATIRTFHAFGIRYALACSRASGLQERSRLYLENAREFNRRIIEHGLSSCRAVYVLDCAGAELMVHARMAGRRLLLEQTIAPKPLVTQILKEETERWPGWEPGTCPRSLEILNERERQEWELADMILSPSHFVLDALAKMGVPSRKCRLVPYAVSLERFPLPAAHTGHHRELRVLFVGAVELRKGAIYLLEALRRLRSTSIHTKLAGGIALENSRIRQYERWAEFLGPVSRGEMHDLYRWADVFVFPSICEGSAIVTYEALANGIPVITTPNAGSVVRDGIDGLIVPIRNVEALAAAMERLACEPGVLEHLRSNAASGRQRLGLECYQQRLRECVVEACAA